MTTPYKWAIFGVLLLGTLLRLHGLAAGGLWYDEGVSISLARFVDLEGSLAQPRNIGEAPLHAVFTAGWQSAIGAITNLDPTSPASDFLLRLLPCLFSITVIGLVFMNGRVLLRDNGGALAAAFLCALSPFQVYYAQELRIYSGLALMALVAVYCLVRALEEDGTRFWAGLVIAEVVLLYMHFFAVWTVLFVNVFFVLALPWYWRRLPKWIIAQAVVTVLVLPMLYRMYLAFQDVQKIAHPWYHFDLSWKTGLITFKNFFAGYGPTTWAYWPLFVLAAGFFLIGLYALWRRKPMAILLVLLTAGPIAVNIFLWRSAEFSFYHHRLYMVSGTVVFLVVGAGVRALQRPLFIGPVLGVFALFMAPLLDDLYNQRLHPVEEHSIAMYHKGDYRAAARYIREHRQPGDEIITASHFLVPSLRHYLGETPVRVSRHENAADTMVKTQGRADIFYRHGLMPHHLPAVAKEADRLWFVVSNGVTFEYKPHTHAVREWLDKNWRRAAHAEFFALEVSLYVRPGNAERPEPPAGPDAAVENEDPAS